MKKVLLALLGLILLAILAYFCFQNKADSIRNNLVSSTNTALTANNITGVNADLKGHDIEMTDIMRLRGEVSSLETKAKAETLTRAVAGIGGVDNQLTVKQQIAETLPLVEKVAKIDENISEKVVQTPVIAEEPAAVVTEVEKINPYTLTITKDAQHKIVIDGYVDNDERQSALVEYASKLFGSENITNDLKVASGAPEDWEHISSFALDRLKDVDYGDMKLSNKSYEFTGHLPSPSTKLKFLDGIRSVMSDPENKYSRYRGDYIITAPVEEPEVIVKEETKKEDAEKESTPEKESTTEKAKSTEKKTAVELCQRRLDTVLKDQKILFDTNKASISKSSYLLLNNVLNSIKECRVSQLEIEGHTDSTGLKNYNKRLSDMRSASVKKYLVKKGFNTTKVKAIGYGAAKPISSNKTNKGRAENRRIEFIVKGVEK